LVQVAQGIVKFVDVWSFFIKVTVPNVAAKRDSMLGSQDFDRGCYPVGRRATIGIRESEYIADTSADAAIAGSIGPRLRFSEEANLGVYADEWREVVTGTVVNYDHVQQV
jgi:hypothetical protein